MSGKQELVKTQEASVVQLNVHPGDGPRGKTPGLQLTNLRRNFQGGWKKRTIFLDPPQLFPFVLNSNCFTRTQRLKELADFFLTISKQFCFFPSLEVIFCFKTFLK